MKRKKIFEALFRENIRLARFRVLRNYVILVLRAFLHIEFVNPFLVAVGKLNQSGLIFPDRVRGKITALLVHFAFVDLAVSAAITVARCIEMPASRVLLRLHIFTLLMLTRGLPNSCLPRVRTRINRCICFGCRLFWFTLFVMPGKWKSREALLLFVVSKSISTWYSRLELRAVLQISIFFALDSKFLQCRVRYLLKRQFHFFSRFLYYIVI